MTSARSLSRGEVAEAGPNLWPTTLHLVAETLDVSALQVLTPDRHQPLPLARQLIGWLLHRWGRWSMPQIADKLGVEPSTVWYYVHNLDRLRKTRPDIKRLSESLARTLMMG